MGVARNRFAAFAAIALLGLVPSLLAQPANGRVSGVVRDATGAGVPGATDHDHQPGDERHTDGHLLRRRQLHRLACPRRVYSVTAVAQGLRPPDPEGPQGRGRRDPHGGLRPQDQASEEITVTAMKREETMHDAPFSVAAPTEEELRSRGVDDIEGVARERGRLHRAEPRPRPEPGRDARRLLGPDRPRPARASRSRWAPTSTSR